MTDTTQNPFVGPRTFTYQEKDRFFGREQEARELRALVLSERLVLFYAQSGAGKSSLINARLIPQLQENGVAVLPVSRVSGELPAGVGQVANIFIFNLLLSLDQGDTPPERFSQMKLGHFLNHLTSPDGQYYYYDDSTPQNEAEGTGYQQPRYLLIIDQFEEIITTHLDRWTEREEFFRQLNQVLIDDPLLWVMLTVREDYVASLEPYAPLLQNKLRARFYMKRLEYEQALEAMKKPAERAGWPFAPGVAESLVDNLRQIRVQTSLNSPTSEGLRGVPGQFVEPVQLQVVGYQLCENLKDRPGHQITSQDVQELGNVDLALAQFYEQALSETISQTNVSEIDLRNWFEMQLITEAGTRGAVYRGAQQTGGLPNQVVDLLIQKFLIRAEPRSGGTWYELVHDRFIEPILRANQTWRLKQPLLQLAQAWLDSGRSDERLLEGQPLQAALAANQGRLGPLVKEFLEASQAAQNVREEALRRRELEQARALAEAEGQRAEAERKRAEAQVKASRRLAGIVAALAIMLLVLIILAGTAFYALRQRQEVLTSQSVATTLLTLDGQVLVSVAEDGKTINVTNIVAQEPIYRLAGHSDQITSIAISPDARYLVSSDEDGNVLVWAMWNGDLLARLTGHSGKVRDVVFSQDGTLMATASDDGTAGLWNTQNWQRVLTMNSDGGPVAKVAFWPRQPGLVTAVTDGTYTLWDPRTGEKVLSGGQ
jgi:hypothetical protein